MNYCWRRKNFGLETLLRSTREWIPITIWTEKRGLKKKNLNDTLLFVVWWLCISSNLEFPFVILGILTKLCEQIRKFYRSKNRSFCWWHIFLYKLSTYKTQLCIYNWHTSALLAPPLKPYLWVFGIKVWCDCVDWCHVVGGPIIFALRGVLVICEWCFKGTG